jgi:hypothetical protein
VSDRETGNSGTTPEYNESFSISNPATWSEHIYVTRCAGFTHGPVQVKYGAHFTFPAHGTYAGRPFTHDNYRLSRLKRNTNFEKFIALP